MTKINIPVHAKTTREVEVSPEIFNLVFKLMKWELMSSVEHSTGLDEPDRYQMESDIAIRQICEDLGIDCDYKKDRLTLFTELLNHMELK